MEILGALPLPGWDLEHGDGGSGRSETQFLRFTHAAYYLSLVAQGFIRSIREVLNVIGSPDENQSRLLVMNVNELGENAESDLAELGVALEMIDPQKTEIAVLVHGSEQEQKLLLQQIHLVPGIDGKNVALVLVTPEQYALRKILKEASGLRAVQMLETHRTDSLRVHVLTRRPDLYTLDEELEGILTMWPDLGLGRVAYKQGYLNFLADVARLAMEKA
jgi:hypothetical protein